MFLIFPLDFRNALMMLRNRRTALGTQYSSKASSDLVSSMSVLGSFGGSNGSFPKMRFSQSRMLRSIFSRKLTLPMSPAFSGSSL